MPVPMPVQVYVACLLVSWNSAQCSDSGTPSGTRRKTVEHGGLASSVPTPRAPRKRGTDPQPPRRLGGPHGSHAAPHGIHILVSHPWLCLGRGPCGLLTRLMEFGAMLRQRDAERNSALGPTPRAPRKLGTNPDRLAGSAAHMAATRPTWRPYTACLGTTTSRVRPGTNVDDDKQGLGRLERISQSTCPHWRTGYSLV
ncbi:hypothetical protein C8T65DRAFT_754406 [Cerioporus squamosus]|nr:hypothetical protein C8T65DRAFT_754406 [Cerioporus squamosus]